VNAYVIALAVLAAVSAIVILARRRAESEQSDGPWPYYAKRVLSEPEQVLFHRLVAAMPECIVLSQVQASRVLGVKSGVNFSGWNNRINRLSLDFLVCLKDSTVVAAIELDDKSHEKPARLEADARKGKALASAGIPLVRWNVSALPTEAEIRNALAR
jgi:hypothetical protein